MACDGSVMRYHHYIVHFKPTAICASCGSTVRFRYFFRVMTVLAVAALLFVGFTRAVDSLALELTAGAALFLFAILGDLWTYRNLTWDPVREASDTSSSQGVSA
jgi:hypothetical protein